MISGLKCLDFSRHRREGRVVSADWETQRKKAKEMLQSRKKIVSSLLTVLLLSVVFPFAPSNLSSRIFSSTRPRTWGSRVRTPPFQGFACALSASESIATTMHLKYGVVRPELLFSKSPADAPSHPFVPPPIDNRAGGI